MFELSPDGKSRILKRAVISRFVEEKLLRLFSEGKLFGTVHTCIGQEFTGAVVAEFVKPGDTLFSNHRCHGHFISHTDNVEGLLAELMGKETGVCAGRGGSQHLCQDGFYSNGIQGGILPVSTGLAFGHQLSKTDAIAIVFIGDGTLGEGAVYESLNIASKWKLPLLIVLEDNKYAQSTSQEETLAGSIIARAEAFGISTAAGNTWDWESLHSTVGEVILRVREKREPAFLVIDTFRLKAHSKGDDNRPREFVEPYEKRDPLNQFLSSDAGKSSHWIEECMQRVEKAAFIAENAPTPRIAPVTRTEGPIAFSAITLPEKRVLKAINESFHRVMENDKKVIFLGEDIRSPYGGAFKVTQGLSDFDSNRVRNMPISESAIVGVGTGLALAGYRPVVEIMFGDFLALALDQILNHAAKFEDMYNGKVEVNLIVRTPMGGGRGYGPTHSQTLDRHFLGIPGLRVLALSHLVDPSSLYDNLFKMKCGPTLVIENKLLYATQLKAKPVDGFDLLNSNETFPTAHLVPRSKHIDLTLFGYGGITPALISAAELLFNQHDLIAQVICPSQIYPLDVEPLLPLIERARHLLIVEEGQGFASLGSEFLAQVHQRTRGSMPLIQRLSARPGCIPASGPMEKEFLPNVDSIVKTCVEMIQ